MSSMMLDVYRARLTGMLDEAEAELTPGRYATLRASVQERRNRRRGQDATRMPGDVATLADAIVGVLDEAGRVLRPRETQVLDDLVAGKEPPEAPPTPRRAPRRAPGMSRSL